MTDWVAVASDFKLKVRWTEEDVWDEAAHTCRFQQLKGDYTAYGGLWTFTPDGTKGTLFQSEIDYELEIPLIGALAESRRGPADARQHAEDFRSHQNPCRATLAGLTQRVRGDLDADVVVLQDLQIRLPVGRPGHGDRAVLRHPQSVPPALAVKPVIPCRGARQRHPCAPQDVVSQDLT